MNPDRSWMYRRTVNDRIQSSFVEGVEAFIAFALTQTTCLSRGMMKCPCNANKCRNRQFLPPRTVVEHLKRKGFVAEYEVWCYHGEESIPFMDYGSIPKRKRRK